MCIYKKALIESFISFHLTGSYSKNLSNDLKNKCFVEPYFVLKSLALIQEKT